jgi:hypothetical protein
MTYCVAFGRGTYAVSFGGAGRDAARATGAPARAAPPSAALLRNARRVTLLGTDGRCVACHRSLIALFLLVPSLASVLHPATAWSRHLARTDPTEPIFTQRSFVEKNIELDTSWGRASGSNTVGFTPGVSWVFSKMLQLNIEVPIDLRIPDGAPTVGAVGDLGLGAQLLLCCGPNGPLDYFSIRADVSPPSGSLKKQIDGAGSWTASLLPARRFTILQQLPDLMVQVQLAYSQDIKPSEASAPADRSVRQKTFLWNTAFAQQYLNGRLRPVFEVLGTTVVDAASAADERTVIELAADMWVAPFPDDNPLSPVSIGLGWKWPVRGLLEDTLTGLLIIEWSFGT